MGTFLFFVGLVILTLAWNHVDVGISNTGSNVLASVGIGTLFFAAWAAGHTFVAGICLVVFVFSLIEGYKDIKKHKTGG